MTRKGKHDIVDALAARFVAADYFYIVDAEGLTVEEVNDFRRRCFQEHIVYQVVKNTLIIKALEKLADGVDYTVFQPEVLKGSSGILFAQDVGRAPAKVILAFQKARKPAKPRFKGALVDQELLVGEAHLDALSRLKSRRELLGDLMALLQSPMTNMAGALQSGGQQLAGVLKALADRQG